MKVTYDKETDSMTITQPETAIKESDEVYPGVILDIGYDCDIVRVEILSASKVVSKLPETQAVVGE
ncbi:MAG: DUF2283 domain-containing protein [Microcoleus vaginatus WJT46-NPBG5]|nr:DUF2283 domain-containing protein [Microcoleus vaginatus WJT46-NPBG5]